MNSSSLIAECSCLVLDTFSCGIQGCGCLSTCFCLKLLNEGQRNYSSYMCVNRLDVQKNNWASGKCCIPLVEDIILQLKLILKNTLYLHRLRNHSLDIIFRSFRVFWWTVQMCTLWKSVLVVSSHSYESSVYCLESHTKVTSFYMLEGKYSWAYWSLSAFSI